MNGRQFRTALDNDPSARVFVDAYAIPSTAHLVGGCWVAHADSTEAGEEISEDRLFAAANVVAWRDEQDRVNRAICARP